MCLGWSSARPVKGGAQCHPVPQAVRSILGHGLDVRGLGLGPSAAVDDPETADRAGVVVGPLDTRGEHPVAKRADSISCRSPIPGHADHGFRSMPITRE